MIKKYCYVVMVDKGLDSPIIKLVKVFGSYELALKFCDRKNILDFENYYYIVKRRLHY